MSAPLVDNRTFSDLAAQTGQLLKLYTGWVPPAQGSDPGQALIGVFARFAGIAIDRLNRAPDKNFIAFLNLLGMEPLPPQAARAPLTFQLAPGTKADALVPARTTVAATPLEGEQDPPVFETESDLVATITTLSAAFVRDPDRDLFTDATAIALSRSGDFAAFQGADPMRHALYVAHTGMFGMAEDKKLTLVFVGADVWLYAVAWQYWDGSNWTPLPSAAPAPGVLAWDVVIPGVPAVAITAVAGISAAWIRGVLKTSMPRSSQVGSLQKQGLPADALSSDGIAHDPLAPFFPFGDTTPRTGFAVQSAEAFLKPGGMVTISIVLDPDRPVTTSGDLTLAWQYNAGGTGSLGSSTPGLSAASASAFQFNDGTMAFTQSGQISFRAPNDVDAGATIMARITKGNFDSAPRILSLTIAYDWPWPKIASLRISAQIQHTALSPDAAFLNQSPVDLTKDFFPLGEKPKFNDTFYVASDEAFSKPRAAVTVDFAVTTPSKQQQKPGAPAPAVANNVTLAWEGWNGQAWEALKVSSDGSANLTANGAIVLTMPDTVASLEVNGQTHFWVRARLAAGDYGHDASYIPVSDKPADGFKLDPSTLAPPSIQILHLSYTYTRGPESPAVIVTENDSQFVRQTVGALFQPFTPSADTSPALYLGFDRPGDVIGFANRSTALYFSTSPIPYNSAQTASAAGVSSPSVVWEYWNGNRWGFLGANDETVAFTRRGLVRFIGPGDFFASVDFGRLAFWLRARLQSGSYATPTRLAGILTNTMWATHTRTIEGEGLGSSTGKENQVFQTALSPVLVGQSVEVMEPELPPLEERLKIEAEEGPDAIGAPVAGTPQWWVRWHQGQDFYGSGPRDRHYLLDRSSGQAQFGDGRYGAIPPQGVGNIRASYQTGGGERGNRPAGALTQMKTAVPFVASVSNPEPAAGGTDVETPAAAQVRGPRALRHRERAVTISDFEDLAFEAFVDVARVKGIPASTTADAGRVGLVVVPKSADPQPVPNLELLTRVQDFITQKLTPTAGLWVAGPDWLRVTVDAEIVPVDQGAATAVQTAAITRCTQFLHPLTGGSDGQGWAFGRRPYRSDIIALLESVPGIDHVRRIEVQEDPLDFLLRADRFLIFSGEHHVTVAGAED